MNNLAPYILGIVGLFTSLVGVIYHNLTGRLADLERQFGNAKEIFNGKTPTIIASATRLDDLERRMGKLEDKFDNWMTRIEEKLDRLSGKA